MMTRNFVQSVLIVILTAAGIGCASSATSITSPSASGGSTALTTEQQLTGTWRLRSIQIAGQPAQPAPAEADYSVTFADGRIAARADCNSCSSAFSVSGSKLLLGAAMACTRAACPTMQFESVFTSLLGGEHTIAISGATMVLSSERGTLSFVR